MPGLTGIRAFAVFAVIVYHSGLSWLPGGYYGVDAFFALSGFLITSLLVSEWRRDSTISLTGFWARRARRLLPGLIILLVGVGVCTAVFPTVLASPHLRSDAIATLLYVANWHFIAEHANYFYATSQPSPLLHTWSLAIEEQFYIVWPVVVIGVLGGRRSTRGSRARLTFLFVIAVAGAVASACLMALEFHSGGDPTRAYYGTDTRAQSLLIGAALAIGLVLWNPVGTRYGAAVVGWLGVVGALGCAILWGTVGETSPLAFRGGFALVALSTAAVIASVALVEEGVLSRVLSAQPIAYLGKISYGIYLWYWPTLLVVDHQETGLVGYPLLAVRVAIVVAVAALSFHLVEQPIRRGSLGTWKALALAPAGAAAALVTIFTATTIAAPAASATVPQSTSPAASPPSSTGPPGGSAASDDPGSPVKVLLVGDSMAGSLGVGLQRVQTSYGVQVVNEGSPGCSVGMDGDFKVLWYTVPPGAPCVSGSPGALLDTWRGWVDTYNPDVVVYFARADLMDQSVGGTWENIGDADYDDYLRARLETAITVLSSRGAHVVFLTSPYYDSGEQPDGSPWPEDAPARVAAYNQLLRSVVSTAGPGVSIVDSGSLLSPGSGFATSVDGITVRCTDGVHLTPQAGEWLGSTILPEAAAWGRAHAASSPSGSWPDYRVAAPTWYSKLTCP